MSTFEGAGGCGGLLQEFLGGLVGGLAGANGAGGLAGLSAGFGAGGGDPWGCGGGGGAASLVPPPGKGASGGPAASPGAAGAKGGWGQRRRERISPVQLTGRIREWKRDFGWIVPDERIDHPEMQGSRLYVHLDDTERREVPPLHAWVTFYLYCDKKGLGAEGVRVSGAPDLDVDQQWFGGPRQQQQQPPAVKREDPAEAMAAAMAAAAALAGKPPPYVGQSVPPRFGPGAPPGASAPIGTPAPKLVLPTGSPGAGAPGASAGAAASAAAVAAAPPPQPAQGLEAQLAAWMTLAD